jgi:small GTP-binding protein
MERGIEMTENIKMRKKICLLGDPAVGKTSLIKKYVYNDFNESYISTIGTEVTKKDISIEFYENSSTGTLYDLSIAIWDIIGQKEFRALISRFYKNANGALLVCDLTRPETIHNLRSWTTNLYSAIGKIPIVFVGNKVDLIDPKTFNTDELLELSGRYGAPWITSSAKDGNNVNDAFVKLGNLIIKNTLYFKRMSTIIDILDAIIVDFCEVNGGLEIGMPLFKEEFLKIPNANLKHPQKDTVESLIKKLTSITNDNKGHEIAEYQYVRFNKWLKKLNT